MTTPLRAAAATLVILSLALTPALAFQTADDRELASYRLTKAGLDRYVAAMRVLAVEIQKDPRLKERQQIAREIEKLNEKEELTDADQARLDALQEKLDAMDEADDVLNLSDAKSIAEMEAQVRKTPALVTALKSAGMSAREYSVFTLVLFQSALTAGLKKSGLLKELPKEVNPENVKFVEEHEKELEAMRRELEALAPPKKGERE